VGHGQRYPGDEHCPSRRHGYEGTDEYVPAGADPYELNKSLPHISDDTGAPVPSQMLAWEQTEKHFTVRAAAPQNLTVRLFNYPAWQVVVNGKPPQRKQPMSPA